MKLKILVRLILSAYIIYMIYRDTHSAWLVVFCSLVSLAQELSVVVERETLELVKELKAYAKQLTTSGLTEDK